MVLIDPLSALQASGTTNQSVLMVLRLIDHLKAIGTTGVFLMAQANEDQADLNVTSLMDTWIVLNNLRRDRDLERRIFIAKSRGMAHSSDVLHLSIGAEGVVITERPKGDDEQK